MKHALATIVMLSLVSTSAAAQNRVDTVAPTTQPATPEQSQILSSQQLRDQSVSTVEDAVLLLTGAQTVPGTSTASKLSVDGLPAGYITVLRDGVPIGRAVGGPSGPGIDLSSLPIDPDTVDRIEVRRGIGPSGTSGVVINIVTGRRERSVTATSRVAAHRGGVHRSDIVASGRAPMGAWSANADASFLDRNGADVDGDDMLDTPSGQTVGASAGVGWREGVDNVDVDARFNTSNRRVDGGVAPFDDRVTSDEVSLSAAGRHQGRWGRFEHTTWGGRTGHVFEKIVRESGFERPKAETRAYRLGNTTGATFFAGKHDLSVSANLRGEWVSRQGETGSFDDAFVGESSIGLGDRWYVTNALELAAQIRGGWAAPWGPALEAELGAAVNLGDGWYGKATLSQSRRLPTTEELYLFFDHSEVGYSVVGNPDLGPETLRSAGAEVGVDRERWGVSAAVFGHLIANGIVTGTVDGQAGVFTYENSGELTLAGVRGSGWIAPGAGLRFTLQHTYQPLADDGGERIALRARHSFRGELSGSWLSGALRARVWADGRLDTDAPEGSPQVPDYAEVSAGISWRPASWIETGVDLRNIGDVRDATWGPAPGRFILAKLELSI